MSDKTGRTLLFATLIGAIAFAVYDEIAKMHRVPVPSRFTGIAIVWGLLGLTAPIISYPLAGSFAFGLLLVLAYQGFSSNASGTNADTMVPAPEPGEVTKVPEQTK